MSILVAVSAAIFRNRRRWTELCVVTQLNGAAKQDFFCVRMGKLLKAKTTRRYIYLTIQPPFDEISKKVQFLHTTLGWQDFFCFVMTRLAQERRSVVQDGVVTARLSRLRCDKVSSRRTWYLYKRRCAATRTCCFATTGLGVNDPRLCRVSPWPPLTASFTGHLSSRCLDNSGAVRKLGETSAAILKKSVAPARSA